MRPLPKTLQAARNEIYRLKNERAFLFLDDVCIARIQGNRKEVRLDGFDGLDLRLSDCYLLHNHPSNARWPWLSSNDVLFAISTNLAGIEAVYKTRRYVQLFRPIRGWNGYHYISAMYSPGGPPGHRGAITKARLNELFGKGCVQTGAF